MQSKCSSMPLLCAVILIENIKEENLSRRIWCLLKVFFANVSSAFNKIVFSCTWLWLQSTVAEAVDTVEGVVMEAAAEEAAGEW